MFVETTTDVEYWIIYYDDVIKSGKLSTQAIFQYSDYKKTGVIESEKCSKQTFVPPIISGLDTEFVIYKDKSCDFYFEYGKNIASFKEDIRRTKFRKEWLDIIRNQVRTIL